jgi:hypothetical protein
MATRSHAVPTTDIVRAYQQTGSVWKAGKSIGLAGQSVHERLRAIGYPLGSRKWTPAEHDEAVALIQSGLPIGEVASRLGRTYNGVAIRISRAGVRAMTPKRRKLPRGAGYDKISIGKHLRALHASDIKPTLYARSVGMDVEMLVQALQRYYPDEWAAWVETRFAGVDRKECSYCKTTFIPTNGKQAYCTRKCGNDARADRSYFAGNRRTTIGLAEKICQQCGRTGVKGLSSHHVLGKENDPDGKALVALCQGCHQLVSLLAARPWADEPSKWESLIQLTWLRRNGAAIVDSNVSTSSIYSYVEIENQIDDDDDTGATA